MRTSKNLEKVLPDNKKWQKCGNTHLLKCNTKTKTKTSKEWKFNHIKKKKGFSQASIQANNKQVKKEF